jgi:hypothetical protein
MKACDAAPLLIAEFAYGTEGSCLRSCKEGRTDSPWETKPDMTATRRRTASVIETEGRMPTVTKTKRRSTAEAESPRDAFAARYPHIAQWVGDGWIEMGRDDANRSFVRALDIGGLIWEGNAQYVTLDEAFQALDAGIAAWLKETG